MPSLRSGALFGSASFVDNNDGTGTFKWTPTSVGVFNTNFYAEGNGQTASGTAKIIVIDGNPPEIQISSEELEIKENEEELELQVNLSGPYSDSVTVNYTVTDETTTSVVDYTLSSGSLTFLPGEVSKTITLLVNDDEEEEETETLSISLDTPVNGTLGTESSLMISILDDDQPGNLLIADGAFLQLFEKSSGTYLGEFAEYFALDEVGGFTYGEDGKLYVSDFGGDVIFRFNSENGEFEDEFSSATELSRPTKIKFGPDRCLYVLNSELGQLIKLSETGEFIQIVTDQINPNGDFLFTSSGTLLITGEASITEYDLDGLLIDGGIDIQDLTSPEAIRFISLNKLLVADTGAHKLVVYDLATLEIDKSLESDSFQSPFSVALSEEGKLFVANRDDSSIVSVNLETDEVVEDFTESYEHSEIRQISFIDLKPRITSQPVELTVKDTESVSFSVLVEGTSTIFYQWQVNGEDIPDAIYPVYTIPTVTPELNGAVFSCIVSNYKGAVLTEQVTLTVEAALLAVEDSYVVEEDMELAVDLESGLLANDTVTEGVTAVVEFAMPDTEGAITVNPDGSFNFIPALNFFGTTQVLLTSYQRKILILNLNL